MALHVNFWRALWGFKLFQMGLTHVECLISAFKIGLQSLSLSLLSLNLSLICHSRFPVMHSTAKLALFVTSSLPPELNALLFWLTNYLFVWPIMPQIVLQAIDRKEMRWRLWNHSVPICQDWSKTHKLPSHRFQIPMREPSHPSLALRKVQIDEYKKCICT